MAQDFNEPDFEDLSDTEENDRLREIYENDTLTDEQLAWAYK